MKPETITAIEFAWGEKGRAHDVALKFRVTTNQVRSIWSAAKAEGRLPNIKRQRGGYDFAAMLEEKLRAQASNASIPPITAETEAPVHGLKEVA